MKLAKRMGRLIRFGLTGDHSRFRRWWAQDQKKRAVTTARKAPAETSAPQALNFHVEAARENAIGIALMNRQQFSDALGHFQRACVLDAQSNVPCMNMGVAFFNMQRYEDARRDLSKAAELDPTNPRSWFNLGLLDKAEGKPDAAITDFQKVDRDRSHGP